MDWKELKQEVQSLEGVQPSEKERILSGWNVLEDCFGTGWFDESASTNHPWTLEFQNKAPWVKASFGIIGERISVLSDINGFEGILKKLKKSDQVKSVQAEINAAWKLLRAGLDVELYEYTHPRDGKKKVDLRTYASGQAISVEVTVPRIALGYHIQMNHCSRLAKALVHPDVTAGMIIYNSLSKLWTENLERKIREAITEALQNQKPVPFRKHNLAEFLIAPKHLESQVDDWKKKRKMDSKMNLMALHLDMNLGHKLHKAVQDKFNQFLDETPGIVYMEGIPFSTWFGHRPEPIEFTEADIEMAATENPDLLFIALGELGYGKGLSVHNVDFQHRNYVSSCHILHELHEENWVNTNPFHRWTNLDVGEVINAFWRTCDSISYTEWMRKVAKSIEKEFEKSKR